MDSADYSLINATIPSQFELNTKHLREMKERKSGRQDPIIKEYRMQTDFKKATSNVEFNTNIQDYSMDDIFSLLDIELGEMENYSELQDLINEKVDKYVGMFKNLENDEVVEFFEKVRSSLLGIRQNEPKNLTEAQRLLLILDDKFNAEKNRGILTKATDTTDKTLFDNSKGAGNPLNRKTLTKLLTVDSRFRRNYNGSTSTDYSVELPYIINNVIELKLSDLELPSTFYPFNDEFENNYFWVKLTKNTSAELYLYVYINPGNYYHTTFIDNINNFIGPYGLNLTFDLDYNNSGNAPDGTGKVSFSTLEGFGIAEVEINFYGLKLTEEADAANYNTSHVVSSNNEQEIVENFYNVNTTIPNTQRCGWMLGFKYSKYTGSTSYTSEGILDILGPKYLYLVLNDMNTSSNINFFSNSEDSLIDGNILARIALKASQFSIQTQGDYSIYTQPRCYYGPVNIHKLEVLLIDEYSRNVSLNGVDFSFALSLTTIYSQTN